MNLTTQQNEAFATYIASQPDLSSKPAGSDGADAIAKLMNLKDVSNTDIYNPAFPTPRLLGALVYSEFIALTQPQQAYWQQLMLQPTIDATNSNIGNGIGSIFFGKQTLVNFQALNRKATRFEVLMFTAANSHICQLDADGRSLFGSIVTYQDVQLARGN